MKKMYPPGYHHNDSVATHVFGYIMCPALNPVHKCMSCHKTNLVMTGWLHCFHDCIYIASVRFMYIYDIYTLFMLYKNYKYYINTVYMLYIYIYIYVYKYIYIYIYYYSYSKESFGDNTVCIKSFCYTHVITLIDEIGEAIQSWL